jgi:chromosome condensin MukBEF MukE localization factor
MSKLESKVITQKDLASLLKLTTRRVRQLTAEGIFNQEGGKYRLVDSVKRYLEHTRKPRRKRPVVRRIITQAEYAAMMPDMKAEGRGKS